MKTRILALVMIMVMVLTACGTGTPEVTPTPELTPAQTPTPTPEPTPEPTPTPYSGPVNPLTGLPVAEDNSMKRPVGIMVNNVKQALPQLGISKADIIYEAHVEGGATRLLAIFQSVDDVGVIGSVRSTRHDFLEIVAGHDAILLHAGGSRKAYNIIDSGKITSFDCVRMPLLNVLYWRDEERMKTMSIEHTLVTSGEWIQNYLPKTQTRLDHQESFTYGMEFVEDGTPTNGQNAMTITVPFSTYKTGVFTYDAQSKRYLVSQFGQPHIDDNNNTQLSVTNVIIIPTTVNVIDATGHVDMDLTKGTGWYACGGKIIPIQWSKDSFNDHIVYKTMEGEILSLGAGKSYVNIIPASNTITYE